MGDNEGNGQQAWHWHGEREANYNAEKAKEGNTWRFGALSGILVIVGLMAYAPRNVAYDERNAETRRFFGNQPRNPRKRAGETA
jgi:hypothetical protein